MSQSTSRRETDSQKAVYSLINACGNVKDLFEPVEENRELTRSQQKHWNALEAQMEAIVLTAWKLYGASSLKDGAKE
jgi:hypothetical protein